MRICALLLLLLAVPASAANLYPAMSCGPWRYPELRCEGKHVFRSAKWQVRSGESITDVAYGVVAFVTLPTDGRWYDVALMFGEDEVKAAARWHQGKVQWMRYQSTADPCENDRPCAR